jgi:protein-S-isoprenylcysteine O-methyltransferase Ste14
MRSLVRQQPPAIQTQQQRPPALLGSFAKVAGNGLLLLFYAAAALGQVVAISQTLAAPAVSQATLCLEVASEGATIAFIAMQFALVIIRRPVLKTAPGLAPIIVTAAATGAPALLVCIPRADVGDAVRIASLCLLTVGMAASAFILGYLGRSFSLLPQARALVVSGPYKRLRHPLYAAELVSMLGVMLQFAQPWALAIFVAAALVLIPRMDFEEKVLADAFAGYGDYVKRTWRLLPGVY